MRILIFFFALLSQCLAQNPLPSKAASEYPNELGGVDFFMMAGNGREAQPISHLDTVSFSFMDADIGRLDDPSYAPPLISPIFSTRQPLFYSELRKRNHGTLQVGYNDGQRGSLTTYKAPKIWRGAYTYLGCVSADKCKFVRFYLETNEAACICVDTSYVVITDTVFVTRELDPYEVISDSIERGMVMAYELEELTKGGFKAKYSKGSKTTVQGLELDACDFAEFAGVPCEAKGLGAIYEAGQQKIGR